MSTQTQEGRASSSAGIGIATWDTGAPLAIQIVSFIRKLELGAWAGCDMQHPASNIQHDRLRERLPSPPDAHMFLEEHTLGCKTS